MIRPPGAGPVPALLGLARPLFAYLPSPSQGVWHLGPFPVRAYALCIIAGMVVAVTWANRRWAGRGGRPGAISDVAMWAVPAGFVGARIYHLITDPELYFVAGRNPWDAFAVWHGGLGIWGGIAGGALGAWYGCRRHHLRFADLAWTVAPVLPVAQALGRVGNYFNQELYGRPSSLPWALEIDPAHRPATSPGVGTYQPTFAYELVWDLGVAALVVWAQRRFALSGWRSFALYVAAYTAGRGWIEALRDDHANHILGLRLNDWTSLLVFAAAVIWIVVTRRQPPPGSFAEAPVTPTTLVTSTNDQLTATDADTSADTSTVTGHAGPPGSQARATDPDPSPGPSWGRTRDPHP